MKKQFRNKSIKQDIRLTLKYEGGVSKIWASDAYSIIGLCDRILDEYEKMKIRITLRQLYYDLVSRNTIPNHDTVYKRITKLLTDARYLGLIDWDAIEDRNRPHDMHAEWISIHSIMQSAIDSYRNPRWSDQKYYVEVLTEKDALSSILQPVTNRWHVRLNVNKGYASASVIYEMARRLAERIKEGKQVVLLYIGDHDPSGLDMIRDIDYRMTEFLVHMLLDFYKDKHPEWKENKEYGKEAVRWVESYFKIESIALTMKQVEEMDLPPNPAKITDPRAKWYIQKYGRISWEVEALNAQYLIDLLNDSIQEYIEMDKYQTWLEKEERDKKRMKEFSGKFKDERTGEKNNG